MARILAVVISLILMALAGVYAAGKGWLGEHWGAGEVNPAEVPAAVFASRQAAQRRAAREVGAPSGPKQILFGDLHVHSTYSVDAFQLAMPVAGGDGAYPVSDACDYARFCSALDFWSINDHALAHTPVSWAETVESIRACNAVAGDPANPDVVAYLGWEWTQMGTRPGNHYGHKNVVLRDLEDGAIPTRPIGARPPPEMAEVQAVTATPPALALGALPLATGESVYLDMATYVQGLASVESCPVGVPVRDLPADCREDAATPGELFEKLDDWGHASIVIPHGTTWGFYTPQGSSWDKQLNSTQHDPDRQTLVEIFSGHGNSEEYRDWEEVRFAADGSSVCPEPRPDYLPSCWQAGEIIRTRCRLAGDDAQACDERAAEARERYLAGDVNGWLAVPGAKADDWLDSGQCRDCFQPSFNYRPRSSVQYMMGLRSFDPRGPQTFRFGFMASSDNHSSRPGTGYKEVARSAFTESRFSYFRDSFLGGRDTREPGPRGREVDRTYLMRQLSLSFFGLRETERSASFFLNGGLIAAHAQGRDRHSIWEAMQRREVYGTSGPRILLWLDLLNPPDSVRGSTLPMGGETAMRASPIFRARAVGSLEQNPGCPEHATQALGTEDLARLCRGECYYPSDTRRPISRIEVVKIRPQRVAGEPIDPLIQDPWRVFECDGELAGCTVHFSDPGFASEGRDALYYVRAIEAPSLAVNAANLRCERGEDGSCLRTRPCVGVPEDDDCLAETEERAWSSPIFVDYAPRAVAGG